MLLDIENGSLVSVEFCDMSDESAVVTLIETIRERYGCINTLVHASGVLHDCRLHDMESDSVRKSFGPKAAGVWYLHRHTNKDEKRHFVMFSSVAAMFVNPGQANYSASNSYLDCLFRVRKTNYLPGVSIQWPEIADVGMAVRKDGSINISKNDMLGLNSVKDDLKDVLSSKKGVINKDILKYPLPKSLLLKDRFPSNLWHYVSNVEVKSTRQLMKNAKSRQKGKMGNKVWKLEEVQSKVEDSVKMVISPGYDSTNDDSSLDETANLMDIGLDSLGAVELSQNLESCFDFELS